MPSKNKKNISLDISDTDKLSIEEIFNSFVSSKNTELEISFKNINNPTFRRIVSAYAEAEYESIESTNTLDVNIEDSNKDVYRITFIGDEVIEEFLTKYSRSKHQDTMRYLSTLKASDTINIMSKNRGSAKKIFLQNYDIVIKSTVEEPVKQFPINYKVIYRYKLRNSFIFKNYRIDLTEVYESPNLSTVTSKFPNYEVELELTNRKISIDDFYSYIVGIIAIVHDTVEENILSKQQKKDIVNAYAKLTDNKGTEILESRNVISLEKQHVINYIPNKYMVTDKADGERYALYLTADGSYLLSINLDVKKINLSVDKKYHNTVLDGELIHIDGKLVYLAFDVIYYDGINYKFDTEYNTTRRVTILNNIIDGCFGNFVKFLDYTDKHDDTDLTSIRKFYENELGKYWEKMNKLIENSSDIFVNRKLYFIPYGIHSSEVFMYADIIWKNYVGKKLVPYNLDGIIYTPINIPYLIKINPQELDSVPLEYKWKKESMNSIDFYIKFDQDHMRSDIITKDDSGEYKRASLYVGHHNKGVEKPINFKVNQMIQVAHIPVIDGEARDVEGNIIRDSTVVEFVYSNDDTISMPKRWIALKTRYDKTESVMKYGKKYGNNSFISNRIWKSIQNPISEEMIASLGNISTHQKEFDIIKKSVGHQVKSTDTYYEKKTDSAKEMRSFNNFVKNNMIQTYCKDKKSVLDIGCGRGGDINKFFNANVSEYVGIDIDANGLFIISDSAVSRYNNLRSTHKHAPKMTFIQADAKIPFDSAAQKLAIPTMTSRNMENIDTYLSGKKFDIINCQFTLHYYLSDPVSWNNFMSNIKNHLSEHGYILITCFDGKLLSDALKSKNKITITYTDSNGNKISFADIIKIYDDLDAKNNSVGLAIDLYNSLINSSGTYLREYLVMPDYLQKEFNTIGLELTETDSFMGLFNVYGNYFRKGIFNPEIISGMSNKVFADISRFYKILDSEQNGDLPGDLVELTVASYKFTMLNRYFVFKNSQTYDFAEPARVVNLAGHIDPGKIFTTHFRKNNIYVDFEKKTQSANKIYKAIRLYNKTIKPSTYIIRHEIPSDIIEGKTYMNNHISILEAKKGDTENAILIYKSPDKSFYPVYYLSDGKRRYLWSSTEAIENLSYLSQFTK